MAEYTADKARIFGAQTVRILNRDDAVVMEQRGDDKNTGIQLQTFGASAPTFIGDVGCLQEGGLNWLVQAHETQLERKRRKADAIETHTQRLMPADALRIRGSHNHANALAALLLVQAAGVNIAKALHGLRTYEGAAHRCETVHIIDDVEYINDSKGTNVGATIAALNGLGESRQRLVLIAGGVGKGQDFSPLSAAVAQHCKAVILIGQSANDIQIALSDSGVAITHASDLTDAVTQASQLCKAGDLVLLSPACASFDMFKNYPHRGQMFAEVVHALALDRGQA
jgi:UDP-N-acetylmuramoylalanine--D-glutamate ligase